MKLIAPLTLALSMSAGATMGQTDVIGRVSPALSNYNSSVVEGDLWQRSDLSPRDRSVVTVATLIARQHTALMPLEFSRALENGVTPAEMSEIVTHLAFYSGWGTAAAAAEALAPIYEAQEVAADSLPGADVDLLSLDMETETAREENVQANHAETAIGVVDYTRETLFRDLWLRPGAAPRRRRALGTRQGAAERNRPAPRREPWGRAEPHQAPAEPVFGDGDLRALRRRHVDDFGDDPCRVLSGPATRAPARTARRTRVRISRPGCLGRCPHD